MDESRNFHIYLKRPSPEGGVAMDHEVTETEKQKKNKNKKKEEKKKIMIVKYKECLKNHAAAIGENARDGCGEFMPAGEEGTPDSLKCSACNCHRNFHRKHLEIEEEESKFPKSLFSSQLSHQNYYYCNNKINGSSSPSNPCDDDEDHIHGRKRVTTKFSEEQKEKMVRFAEKAGWKMQKLEDSVVQQFCQELGVKRKVLKVWMHNNKKTYQQGVSSSGKQLGIA